MPPIFAIILFVLIGITILVMIVINLMYRNVRKLREAAEDYMYHKEKQREQKEKHPFGEDYFKSSNNKQNGRNQSQQYATNNHKTQSQNRKQQGSQQKETTARRTTTDSGVTIIDDRNEEKKIFNSGDGEYVEFEEVHG